MGIGLGYPWNLDYYGPIDQLYVYGVTASRAFSLDLASIDVADGTSFSYLLHGLEVTDLKRFCHLWWY
jgi:hypothetical protein